MFCEVGAPLGIHKEGMNINRPSATMISTPTPTIRDLCRPPQPNRPWKYCLSRLLVRSRLFSSLLETLAQSITSSTLPQHAHCNTRLLSRWAATTETMPFLSSSTTKVCPVRPRTEYGGCPQMRHARIMRLCLVPVLSNLACIQRHSLARCSNTSHRHA